MEITRIIDLIPYVALIAVAGFTAFFGVLALFTAPIAYLNMARGIPTNRMDTAPEQNRTRQTVIFLLMLTIGFLLLTATWMCFTQMTSLSA